MHASKINTILTTIEKLVSIGIVTPTAWNIAPSVDMFVSCSGEVVIVGPDWLEHFATVAACRSAYPYGYSTWRGPTE